MPFPTIETFKSLPVEAVWGVRQEDRIYLCQSHNEGYCSWSCVYKEFNRFTINDDKVLEIYNIFKNNTERITRVLGTNRFGLSQGESDYSLYFFYDNEAE